MKQFLLVLSSLVLSVPAIASAANLYGDDNKAVFKQNDKTLMQYRHGKDAIKPYVEYLATPAGVNILRDSPFDHKHHHGLMFAVAVDGVNFWEEREPFGREVNRQPLKLSNKQMKNGAVRTLNHTVDWIGPHGDKPLLVETRTIEHEIIANQVTLLTWQTELALPPGKASAKISGNPYYGLGMRFVASMDKDGRFINADGKTGVKATNKERSTWCAYSAKADGKPVTVAMFDHPKNFRHPATWFTMEKPFAYLSVTLDLKTQPIEMQPSKPLLLEYGVALWDGTPTEEEIEKVYKQWVSLSERDKKSPSTKPAE